MEDNYRGPEDIEQLVEEAREFLRKARPSLNFSMAKHFASFPSNKPEPTSVPYSLPPYVRRNLELLAPESD